MKQIGLLTVALINAELVAIEQLDSWVENLEIVQSGKNTSNGGVILFKQNYDAVITIERFPHKRHPVELLFAIVIAWLMDNDNERTDNINAKVSTDVDVLDSETADIIITVGFSEDVEVVPDPSGKINFNGNRYRLETAVVDYAESGEVA